MINPSAIDLSLLPSVAFSERFNLPTSQGVYFAIDSQGTVQYIGSATGKQGLYQRWNGKAHHQHERLNQIPQISLAYMEIDAEADMVLQIEEALIKWFNPPLNSMTGTWRIIRRSRQPKAAEPVPTLRTQTLNGITFGQWLKLMRDRLDIPQTKIADALSVKAQTVSNWENGKSIPSLTPEQTRELCDLLQVNLNTLAKAYRGEVEIND